MKKKSFNKKLVLNKEAISNLDNLNMRKAKGGKSNNCPPTEDLICTSVIVLCELSMELTCSC